MEQEAVLTWATLDPNVRQIAQAELTDKQLAAYKLSVNGMSEQRISTLLGISRRAVRDRLHTADVKIARHPDHPERSA